MKVSFDFDGTLDRISVQKYAKFLIDIGIDVYITTKRYEKPEDYSEEFCKHYGIKNVLNEHNNLFEVAKELNIPFENIHFMNMEDKSTYLKDKDFIWHLDDDPIDIKDINQNSDVIGISCAGSNWAHKCNKLINGK